MEVVAMEVEDDKQGKSLPWVWGSIDRRVQLVSDVVGLKRMCPLVLAQNSHSNKGNPWWKMMVHRVVGGSRRNGGEQNTDGRGKDPHQDKR